MAVNDPIADYLTRIRNAQIARHRMVDIPASNVKKRITEILYDQGYILRYKFVDDDKQGMIRIAIKYNKEGDPVIKRMGRISRQSLRKYAKSDEMPRVLNGLGISIISTSKGIMTGKKASQENVGGELLCYVY